MTTRTVRTRTSRVAWAAVAVGAALTLGFGLVACSSSDSSDANDSKFLSLVG
ncbi:MULTISPECIES: hypothetical protein [Corynebacterium]|uniref:hypothetical protein n=1 Tax=Corynebacterium TaxID=1716 RepID=UPI00254EE563|nr:MULTISPECIES: hypothetical protein [unclassified Corynebacterium]MDK8831211.1 hypothetical protein [Corynebacterium sp. MSK072]